MKTIIETKNFNIQEVHAYAVKMVELVNYMFANIYTCKNFGSFHFKKNMTAVKFMNNDSERENQIFTVIPVSAGAYNGHSNVYHKPFPYKFEYFENSTEQCLEVSTIKGKEEEHWVLDHHKYYSVQQLEDEGFLFQQSLVMEEEALFGICCASWLYHMNVRFTYIICEFDVDEMNRVHKVVFDDVRS